MKIVVACDSFKACMTSKEAAGTIERGIKKANPEHEVLCFPMADGGEGTAQVFCELLNGEMEVTDTIDAYGERIEAGYAYCRDRDLVVMDVASCIGLGMVPKEKRNPLVTNSRGVGRMLKNIIDKGYKNIVIGLGGSSTTDGGMGVLAEFGVIFYDQRHRPLRPSSYGLGRIAYIDRSEFYFPKDVNLIVASDVKNPLLGEEGAVYVFGRQKGIFPNQMEEVDDWMAHYVQKMEQTFHVDLNANPGAGAAGGLGAVFTSVFGARMVSGVELCVEYAKLEDAIKEADLVYTGEGQSDAQTKFGKVPYGILQVAKKYNKPVICLSGALGLGYDELYEEGFIGIFSAADRAMDFHTALSLGPEKMEALAYSMTKCLDGFTNYVKGTMK